MSDCPGIGLSGIEHSDPTSPSDAPGSLLHLDLWPFTLFSEENNTPIVPINWTYQRNFYYQRENFFRGEVHKNVDMSSDTSFLLKRIRKVVNFHVKTGNQGVRA